MKNKTDVVSEARKAIANGSIMGDFNKAGTEKFTSHFFPQGQNHSICGRVKQTNGDYQVVDVIAPDCRVCFKSIQYWEKTP